ncbi:glycerophosphodiester phosphodiesterase [Bradyrhizobium sp. Arg68]|uniref:glycerophosphodiester phosphodiesterase n=1 Tax=Bradyrhizobium ivorense TaxID=2511166 RepID=UPI001E5CF60F|nr:glycerophosphodiester phosphodiesterase [Bradyrhizobium ivorense]MCC8940180.1 glycerophosphodiester phosphodiesterase [Bradyrhizobium ivorense]
MKVGFLARGLALAAAILALCPAYSTAGDRDDIKFRKPLVIGHRGAHGYLPAHTLEGYALAIELGADFIEPDLVATRDGHLIASHEPNLIATTDVASRPEYASRRRTVVIDGAAETGFFASDFSLVEIKRLRRVQDFADRPQQFNGKFEIPTLEEIIALVKRKSEESGRTIGIYPETKHPTYHKSIGLPLEQRLVQVLAQAGWSRRDAPVFIQSFEQSNLMELRRMTPVRLIQLVDANDVNADGSLDYTAPFDRPYDWTASRNPRLLARTFGYFATDAGLQEIKSYADGIGPWKRYVVSSTAAGLPGPGEASRKLLPAGDLIERAHKVGLLVHMWTFRNEQKRLVSDYQGNPVNEYLQFYRLGIDGVFSDFADTAIAARVLFRLERDPDFGRCFTGDRGGAQRSPPNCE